MAKFSNICLLLEFQDPLLGAEMVRTQLNARAIFKLEDLFIATSCKTIFVTKKSTESAKLRHPKSQSKIECIYPGSWEFIGSVDRPGQSKIPETIEFLHLGTLYGSRNLNNLFAAMDQLRIEKYPYAERIHITNLGDIYSEHLAEYESRKDFTLLSPVPRVNALLRAQSASFLLLVQHTDGRSAETIPYKTYDYFNVGRPVFAIINNSELESLIRERGGYVADSKSVNSIKETMKLMINDMVNGNSIGNSKSQEIDIRIQFAKLLDHVHQVK